MWTQIFAPVDYSTTKIALFSLLIPSMSDVQHSNLHSLGPLAKKFKEYWKKIQLPLHIISLSLMVLGALECL